MGPRLGASRFRPAGGVGGSAERWSVEATGGPVSVAWLWSSEDSGMVRRLLLSECLIQEATQVSIGLPVLADGGAGRPHFAAGLRVGRVELAGATPTSTRCRRAAPDLP